MNQTVRTYPHSANARIAIAVPSLLPLGGVERTRLALASEFVSRGYEVDLVVADEMHDNVKDYLPPGANLIILGVSRIRNVIPIFAKYIRDHCPDAIIASMWPFTSACTIANKLAGGGSRILVSDHNPLSIQYGSWGLAHRWMMRFSLMFSYQFADCHVAVSSGVADDISKLSRLSRQRITVIPNPVFLPEFPNEETTQENSDPWKGWKGKRIISVGRLKSQKNFPLLLRAFKELRKRIEAKLMIVGTGELELPIRQLGEQLGLGGDLILVGHLDNVRFLYQSADVLALSSDYEGFGNVLVEALSCGLTVVSTDCPSGPREILEKGKWGILVPVGDAESLATGLLKAIEVPFHPELLLSRASQFNLNKIADEYLRLLFPAANKGPA